MLDAQGAKGVIEHPLKPSESFRVSKIVAYDSHGNTLDVPNATTFLQKCYLHRNIVFKKFYGSHAFENFQNELSSFIHLASTLAPKQLLTHTAIRSLPFENRNVYGFSVVMNGSEDHYVINQKGAYTLEYLMQNGQMDVDMFRQVIHEVLESLIMLSHRNILHGDVKPSNIMVFGMNKSTRRFKLIDWEYMRSCTDVGGCKYGAHPIYFDKNRFFKPQIVQHYVDNVMCPSCESESSLFYKFMKTSWDSYSQLKDMYDDHQLLRKPMLHGLDTYNIGLMVYALYVKLGLEKDYEHFANNICCFKHGLQCCPLSLYNQFTRIGDGVQKGLHRQVYPLEKLSFKSLYIDLMRIVCKGQYDVTLYTEKGKFLVDNNHVLESISNDTMHVAKEYIPRFMSFNKHAKTFEKELYNTRVIHHIFKHNFDMTSLPMFRYKNNLVYGMSCDNKYALLSLKGNYSIVNAVFDDNMVRELYKNLYTVINILHHHEYQHMDIKPENIVHFDKDIKYRLIDWQKLCKAHVYEYGYKYHGSTRTGSPVSFFLEYGDPRQATTAVEMANKQEYQLLSRNKRFLIKYRRVMKMFQNEFRTMNSIEDVFAKWKYNIDLFGLGMTMLYVLHRNKIKDVHMENIGYRLLTARHITDAVIAPPQ